MEISNGHNQEMALSYPSPSLPRNQQQEKKPRYQQNQAPNSCPRCDSTNTKFCYYNNYSLSQPRYFCKACRRYWTKGGILRNVPVGGGCRKNKRSSSSSNPSFSTKKSLPQRHQDTPLLNSFPKPPPQPMATSIPNFPLPNDLTLAFDPFLLDSPNPNPNPSFLDILRGGGVVGPTHQGHGGGGFQSLCYGFGGGGGNDQRAMLAFHGGSDGALMAAAAPVMAVRNDDDDNDDAGGGVGLGLESGREYWNDSSGSAVSSSSWHGLVNTSFL